MDTLTSLEELGLTPNEAAVYLALLKEGQTGAGELVKRTGMHRNMVYETLERLIAKHLAFRLESSKVATFQATDPERIVALTRSKAELAEELLPSLVAQAGEQQEVMIFEGIEGFRRFNLEQLETAPSGTEILVLGSLGSRWYELMGDATGRFVRTWKKKDIRFRVVAYREEELDSRTFGDSENYQVRYLRKESEPPADTLVWNDRIALQTAVEPVSVIEIRNRALAMAYREYFETMWRQAEAGR